ncbi:MAG: low molecular weight protein tyrosine phosphatase family protein [Candidatus Competibacterales bacterium]
MSHPTVNLLFVCSQNRLRSPTAEVVFADYPGVTTLSAGTDKDAETPLSGDLVQWADVIFAMERTHRHKIAQRFGPLLKDKRLVVLDIKDRYGYLDQELIRVLKTRVPRYVRL